MPESIEWLKQPDAFARDIRRMRVVCLDVLGQRADALAEARVFADVTSGSLPEPAPLIEDSIQSRGAAYSSLIQTAIEHDRPRLADALLRAGGDYALIVGAQHQHTTLAQWASQTRKHLKHSLECAISTAPVLRYFCDGTT